MQSIGKVQIQQNLSTSNTFINTLRTAKLKQIKIKDTHRNQPTNLEDQKQQIEQYSRNSLNSSSTSDRTKPSGRIPTDHPY